MSASLPIQTHADLDETKGFLNIPLSDNTSNVRITNATHMADNYINNQIQLHELIPIVSPDPELTSMASAHAAAIFNYFQSPDKTNLMTDINGWKKSVQEHILANYGKKNPTGLAGGQTFGKTSAMTGIVK
jgi:hypothetical protein